MENLEAESKPIAMGATVGLSDVPSFVVGIGSSAGGLEALERFFKALPSATGMAFVVIQHLSPDFKSLMADLLARFTTMPICPVQEPTELKKDTVYLLPPRKEMHMEKGCLLVYDKRLDQSLGMPISMFFSSLAEEQGDKAIGIVFSGTGTDGSTGLVEIHNRGGMVLVQTAESAKFDGMPLSAIATGVVDAVLSPEEMPTVLLAYAQNPTLPLVDPRPMESGALALVGLPAVVEQLREVYGVDFNCYKPATIARRVDRRASLGHAPSFQDYTKQVLENPEELDTLYKDLLIGVTRFFRDSEAFEYLEREIVPRILDSVPPDQEIRVWVPGCATGEEAYSLGMLFLEACDVRKREPNLKIFASDLHRESLHVASEGRYPESKLDPISAEKRDRFFQLESDVPSESHFRVIPRLRKLLIFSPHNLLKDPPFPRVDLVSCRNLLIYFQPFAQAKALASLHFSVKLKGYLFLGPSEGLGELQDEFATLSRHHKIFQKVQDTRLPMELRLHLPTEMKRGSQIAEPLDPRLSRAYETLLQRYIPTGVLISERRRVLRVFGDADRFLRPSPGRMNSDVVGMTRGDLRAALSSVIQNALIQMEKVVFRGVRCVEDNQAFLLNVIAEPILDKGTNSTFLLVLFEEERSDTLLDIPVVQHFELAEVARTRIQQLETELRQTKDSLQTTVEELETSNEELQASNEELLASNEELQSANEELHSLNEELYSVNVEYEQKIKELNEITSDLKNLILATDIGIIFTDTDQRVRLFTPRAADLLNLLPQDIGRDIKHITSRIQDDDWVADLSLASAKQERREKQITTNHGRSYLRCIAPYVDMDKAPAGLVLSFVDITELKEAEKQFRLMIESAPQAVIMVDGNGKIVHFNAAAEKVFGYERGEVLGEEMERLLPEQFRGVHKVHRATFADAPVLRPMAGRELMGLHKNGKEFPAEVGISPVQLGDRRFVVAFITDITARRKMQEERDRIERKMMETQKLESLGVLAGGIAHDFNNLLTGIIGNASLVLKEATSGSPTHESLLAISESAERAADLCKQMLAYSGRGHFVVCQHDLNQLVENTTHLLTASIGRNVNLQLDLAHTLPPVTVDAVQIRQVIMNLVINAAEAIGDRPGEIQINTGVLHATRAYLNTAANATDLPEGTYVFLSVTDTGCGIKTEDLPRIFEPFFTTKFTGRGLGLSGALGIARGHQGAIFVSSEVGCGTTFKMLIPPSDEARVRTPVPKREDSSWRGSGVVLLVDDEEVVRYSAARMLRVLGFDTVLASDGRDGVAKFAQDPKRFTLVLLDLTMPNVDGIQAFAEMRRIDAHARILLTSGYNEQEASASFAGKGLTGFVQKPFDLAALRSALRQALQGSQLSGPKE